MQFLRKNTAVQILVGPFVDLTNGYEPETGMTVTNITAQLLYEDDDNTAPHLVALTLSASGGDNDMAHLTDDVGGFYTLELTAANTNFTGRARLSFIDADVMRPLTMDFFVLDANVYDALLGADKLQVHAAEITNDLITADAIADDAIGADQIGAGAIVAATFGAGAIDAAAIKDAAIDAATFAAGAINAAAIASDAIEAAKIKTGAITNAKFAAGAIDAAAIADNAIDAGAIASDAITAAKIATGAITAAKFAAGAIDAAAIKDAAIDAATFAADALAAINAEVKDVLDTDARAEIAAGAPGVNVSTAKKIDYLYQWYRNKKTNDGSVIQYLADDGTTPNQQRTVAEAGGKVTEGEIGAVP